MTSAMPSATRHARSILGPLALAPLVLAFAAGCGAHAPRIERSIHALPGVVITNSLALQAAPRPRARGGRLVLDYPLLAESHGPGRAELFLAAARAALVPEREGEAVESFRIACLAHDAARRAQPVLVLEPGERARVDCQVEIPPEHAARLADADRDLILGLPMRTSSQATIATFGYALRAGDAP